MSGSGVLCCRGVGALGRDVWIFRRGGVIVRVRWDRRKSGRERTGEVNEFQLSPREAFRCVTVRSARLLDQLALHVSPA